MLKDQFIEGPSKNGAEKYGYVGLVATPPAYESFLMVYREMHEAKKNQDVTGVWVMAQQCINYLAKELAKKEAKNEQDTGLSL